MESCFICIGDLSAGEYQIMFSFIKSLDLKSIKIIINENYKHLAFDVNINCEYVSPRNDILENKNIIFRNVSEADNVFLFDPSTFNYSSSWSGVAFFELLKMGKKIIGYDEFGYSLFSNTKDYYPNDIITHPPFIAFCDYVILSASYAKKKEYKQMYVYNSSFLSGETSFINKRNTDTKKILITFSKWEIEGSKNEESKILGKLLLPMLISLLELVNTDFEVIIVGECVIDFLKEKSRLKIIQYDQLKSDEYTQLLSSIDLYLTFNIMSVTLNRMLELGIPSIVLNNSMDLLIENIDELYKKYVAFKKDLIIKKFSASTFGWHDFIMKRQETKYMESLCVLEFFDSDEIVKTVLKILNSENTFDDIHPKYLEYVSFVEGLDDAQTIYNNIIERGYKC